MKPFIAVLATSLSIAAFPALSTEAINPILSDNTNTNVSQNGQSNDSTNTNALPTEKSNEETSTDSSNEEEEEEDKDWNGFYIGATAGYGWAGSSTGKLENIDPALEPFVAAGTIPRDFDLHPQGFEMGPQAGFNYQKEKILVGIEVDIQPTGIRDSNESTHTALGFSNTTSKAKTEIDWFGTVRARLGFVPYDPILLYVTGGYAYGRVKDTASVIDDITSSEFQGSKRSTRSGWTWGAGAEYAAWNNFSIKVEYLYIDLSDTSLRLTDPDFPGSFINYKFDHRANIVRAGVNYFFDIF